MQLYHLSSISCVITCGCENTNNDERRALNEIDEGESGSNSWRYPQRGAVDRLAFTVLIVQDARGLLLYSSCVYNQLKNVRSSFLIERLREVWPHEIQWELRNYSDLNLNVSIICEAVEKKIRIKETRV